MDVILKVLEGAKTGAKIAVKKDEFLIGRSHKCHLCAGSSSVSRNHCAITRKDATVSIKDLGSRNGTLVNDKKISEEVELSSGDELGIGSLKLLVTITHGINNLKRPKVKTVADAVERTVATGDSSVGEDDITQWLLDSPGPPSTTQAANETQTIQLDDTNAIQLKKEREKHQNPESETDSAVKKESDAEAKESPEGDELPEGNAEETTKSGKKEPGKLPKRSKELGSKDSREAAMQALRNWSRRN